MKKTVALNRRQKRVQARHESYLRKLITSFAQKLFANGNVISGDLAIYYNSLNKEWKNYAYKNLLRLEAFKDNTTQFFTKEESNDKTNSPT